MVLGIELRAFYMPGKHCATDYSQPCLTFYYGTFKLRQVEKTVAPLPILQL